MNSTGSAICNKTGKKTHLLCNTKNRNFYAGCVVQWFFVPLTCYVIQTMEISMQDVWPSDFCPPHLLCNTNNGNFYAGCVAQWFFSPAFGVTRLVEKWENYQENCFVHSQISVASGYKYLPYTFQNGNALRIHYGENKLNINRHIKQMEVINTVISVQINL